MIDARRLSPVFVLIAAAAVMAVVPFRQDDVSAAQVEGAVEKLGNLDYSTRTNAGRTVRRAPATVAVPMLLRTVAEHADGYVRFRALVLLAGFNDLRTKDVMRGLLKDPNDRLRQVAYKFFEHQPDPTVVPTLLEALQREESEFVRPTLVRALAANGGNPKVQQALSAEVDRGQDFFRSAVIEALGDYRASYAFDRLVRIATQDGPLQDDAALALGKIGDKRVLPVLASLQSTVPRSTQPTVAAGICLLGVNCSSHQGYIEESLRFAVANPGYQELLRAAAASLDALASRGNTQALGTLFDVGIPSTDPARAPIALALGSVALRNPKLMLDVLEKRPDLDGAVALLGDAFDQLEEDFEEERFFVTVRRTYWQAPKESPTQKVAAALIDKLEF